MEYVSITFSFTILYLNNYLKEIINFYMIKIIQVALLVLYLPLVLVNSISILFAPQFQNILVYLLY